MPDPAPYLTAEEAIARLNQLSEFDPADIERAIASFEPIAEQYRGEAYRRRSATVKRQATQAGSVALPDPLDVTVTAVSVDEVALTAGQLALLHPVGEDCILRGGSWQAGARLVVTYTHGHTAPPALILDAAAQYAFSVLRADRSGTTRDVIATSFDGGFTRYSTPSWKDGRPTGWLEVDRLLNSVSDERIPGIA